MCTVIRSKSPSSTSSTIVASQHEGLHEAGIHAPRPGQLADHAVAVVDDVRGEVSLRGAVREPEGARIDPEEIKAYVKERVAPYKYPRIITIAPEPLPKSGSGKILKKEIRKQYVAAD